MKNLFLFKNKYYLCGAIKIICANITKDITELFVGWIYPNVGALIAPSAKGFRLFHTAFGSGIYRRGLKHYTLKNPEMLLKPLVSKSRSVQHLTTSTCTFVMKVYQSLTGEGWLRYNLSFLSC